jgi:hypothetical protein
VGLTREVPPERLPFGRRIYDGWSRSHPFDGVYGTDTSGTISVAECAPDVLMAPQMSPYGGSQRSIVRAGIASLIDLRSKRTDLRKQGVLN